MAPKLSTITMFQEIPAWPDSTPVEQEPPLVAVDDERGWKVDGGRGPAHADRRVVTHRIGAENGA